ncbi:MAG: regulatory signaling modulator protein AmpE [Cellvibrionales bacterium]|nr:regulatory signaling modulator protein AmpE [Cellvibrionales bacterium]
MESIAIVIVLLMLQFRVNLPESVREQWFFQWADISHAFPMGRWCHVILTLGIPCFIAVLLLVISSHLGFIVELVVYVLILLLAITPKPIFSSMFEVLEKWQLDKVEDVPEVLESLTDQTIDCEDKPLDHLRMTQNTVFITAALRSWFAPIFWFVVVNPVAALLYRLIQLMVEFQSEKNEEVTTILKQLLDWLEWPAARLLGLSFIVSGKAGEVFSSWCEGILSIKRPNEVFLNEQMNIALAIEPEDNETQIAVLQDRVSREVPAIKSLIVRCFLLVAVVALVV